MMISRCNRRRRLLEMLNLGRPKPGVSVGGAKVYYIVKYDAIDWRPPKASGRPIHAHHAFYFRVFLFSFPRNMPRPFHVKSVQ